MLGWSHIRAVESTGVHDRNTNLSAKDKSQCAAVVRCAAQQDGFRPRWSCRPCLLDLSSSRACMPALHCMVTPLCSA